ncbi:MAG TPA: cbb3-type cytochrome c oxidase subunit I, partial [Steroidobacteraceae bacterium]|nr:cbb3-type cytochrome c oxidase subunit I [Steroidobacteraceae bacterium]
ALLIGLFLWLGLMVRALLPALRRNDEQKPILTMLIISSTAIAGFYGAALGYGRTTNLAVAEYWRWWVVHLWVEGFFEVFATAVIAFLFTRLGLLRVSTATVAVLFATIVFLSGGVLGTLHHLYFTGTPTAVIALGASFSALEVVPLAFIGFEAYQTFKLGSATPWMRRYRWPIMFFTAVAFWNLVGAGLFGFLINPPLPLYYMQGLNLTPLHGHTALFGVYGFLGLGLMLFCLRGLKPNVQWNERALNTAFWSFNIGLAGMSLLTLLPIGLIQLNAAIEHGYWYARSADLMQKPLIQTLVWMRVPGDIIFSVGAFSIAWFVLRLWVAPKQVAEELPVGTEPANR